MADILSFIPDHQSAIRNADLPGPRWTRQKIGLLGGSFNPAHEGHLHISHLALKALKLDWVWWLVSPQNPLKDTRDMADFEERLTSARAQATHPKCVVTDIEKQMGTQYTLETLTRMQHLFPHARFVWLMGADNLQTFHHWGGWEEIAQRVPMAVFDRAPYTYEALRAEAATALRPYRLERREYATIADREAPAWAYLHLRRHPASSTAIRDAAKNDS